MASSMQASRLPLGLAVTSAWSGLILLLLKIAVPVALTLVLIGCALFFVTGVRALRGGKSQ